jgi:hypothetical protein
MPCRHCSTIDGEVCSDKGLLSSCQVATSVASVAAVGGGDAAVLDERWWRGAVAPITAVVRLPTRRDRPTLKREVASPYVSHSW